MKVFLFALAAYLPALFWDLPAVRFNIVEASEPTEINRVMAETYLKAGLTFAEGLEREIRSTNFKTTAQPQVINQLNAFGIGMQANFRQASLHVGNFASERMRMLNATRNRPVLAKFQVEKVLALTDYVSASVFNGRTLSSQETLLKQIEEIQVTATNALAQIQSLKK